MADPIRFVNTFGCELTDQKMQSTAKLHRKPRPVSEREPTHKGFRVVGHPPGALESAKDDRRRVIEMAAASGGAPIPPFDEQAWRAKTKKKPVAKPYAIRSSAITCADLARRAGWFDVDVVELVKE
jgi:hypothetical protein